MKYLKAWLLLVCLILMAGVPVFAQVVNVLDVISHRNPTHWQLKVQADKPVEPLVVQCLIDEDDNPQTGFTGGFDLLVESDLLYRFAGAQSSAWTWKQVCGIGRKFNGTYVTYSIPLASLKETVLRMQVRLFKKDYSAMLGQSKDVVVDLEQLVQVEKTLLPVVKLAPVKANRHLSSRQRVRQAKSFYCYYGSGKVGQLSNYDLVILHSPQMASKDIATLKKQGVVTVGYITVGEDDKLREGNGKGPDGKASWYFDRDHDGMPDQNSIWKSHFANPMDPLWRQDRVREAKRLVYDEGYDGIFLDTIDTVSRFPDTEPGMIQLVRDLRVALPNSPIILNQGYSLLVQLAPMADAFMLESFTATYNFQTKQYALNSPSGLDWHTHKVRKFVEPVLKKNPLTVLVLDYAKRDDLISIQKAADRAATFGYLFASAPIYLDEVYVNDVVGKPDPKWFLKQATPQGMSFAMPESGNGFPMNTVVMPSSCFGGYEVKSVIDGIANRASLHWSESAWASAEVEGEDVWLSFEFDAPLSGGKLEIIWATDQSQFYVSQKYFIQVKRNDHWQDIVEASGEHMPVSIHALPQKSYQGIRIYQSAGNGSKTRPNLMWIAQVKRHVH